MQGVIELPDPCLRKVLVVDDEPSARSALAVLLRDEGFAVRTAADGVEALRRMDDWTPDLLLTDFQMPGMDGNELMQQVRGRHAEVGVILVTAHASLERAVDSMRQGADDYLTKPLQFDELLVVARRVLERQELRRENVRLKHAAISMRDEVLGVVAHDLRNLLAPISARATIVRSGGTLEQAQVHAAAIEDVVRRMGCLVTDLLDVASLDAGRFSVVPTHCEPRTLFADTNTLFGAVAAAKAVTLRLRVDDGELDFRADRDRLLQIIANLVGNAIKFTARGTVVEISAQAGAGSVTFAIRDQGAGIPAGDVARVFEPFWKTNTPGVKGSGLGLFIAKRLVEAQGGRIWVESTEGEGSTFYFTLPLESRNPGQCSAVGSAAAASES